MERYLIVLVLFLFSCQQFPIQDMHPTFLDNTRQYGRVYKAVKVSNPSCGQPDYQFTDSGTRLTFAQMDEYICLKPSEYQEMYRYYLNYLYKNQNCANPRDMNYDLPIN